MTVNEFIKELQSLKPDLRNKEVFIKTENGLFMRPKIKYYLYPEFWIPFEISDRTVKGIVLEEE